MLDQRRLPVAEVWEEFEDPNAVADAIVAMKVRGAPAIAAAAAYAVALAGLKLDPAAAADRETAIGQLEGVLSRLAQTRPTAVNLFWAIQRMRTVMEQWRGDELESLRQALIHEAERIADEDVAINRRIGQFGAQLFPKDGKVRVLTHCNTGSLATAGYGTALGVIRALAEAGRLERVYVDETRPFLQGARLTAYELGKEGIAHTLITDNMAAHFMRQGEIDAVLVGADRIAANGDTANKIGTYGLAVLAHHHRIPFYVAAPTSSFDLNIESGEAIPIEQRSPEEVTHFAGHPVAPVGTEAAHPAFDVTPSSLITAIICERGVIEQPNRERVAALLRGEEDER
jgi:methylthioribose-1-phosphate isomerase